MYRVYTTVLPLLVMILKYFAPGTSCGIQMADLRIMNQVFYHCAVHDFKIFCSCGIHLGDLRIMNQVFYHCATIASDDFKIFFLLKLTVGLKWLILGL
jgi:hypothetical protein